jgi:hypothetical protein
LALITEEIRRVYISAVRFREQPCFC